MRQSTEKDTGPGAANEATTPLQYVSISTPDRGEAQLALQKYASKINQNRSLWGTPALLSGDTNNHTTAQTEKMNRAIADAWDRGESSSWIITRVIHQELQLTVPEYMKLSNLEKPANLYHALKPLSDRGRQGGLRDETYSTLLRDWKSIPSVLGEEFRPVLEEASNRLRRYLIGKDHGTPFGLIRSWALEVGPSEFEKSTNLSIAALRKGHRSRSKFLSFSEFAEIGQKAGLLPQKISASELWDDPSTLPVKRAMWSEAGKFQRSKSVATALMLFDVVGAGRTVEQLHQNEKFTLPWNVARSLHQYDLVPWKKVSAVFSQLVNSGEISAKARDNLRTMWRKEEAESESALTFAREIRGKISEREISWPSILSAMRVPEQSEIGTPKELVRFALEHELRYAALPIGVLAFFAADSAGDAQNLLELKRTEIEHTLLRRERGSTNPHPLRIERDLWSVSIDEISDGKQKDRIQAAEWRRRTPDRLTREEEGQLLKEIETLGFERAEAALTNWLEENPDHPASTHLENLVRTFPGFSIAGLREEMIEEVESRRETEAPQEIPDALPTHTLEALVYGDSNTFAGTEERIRRYRERAELGLPVFNENDTEKTQYE